MKTLHYSRTNSNKHTYHSVYFFQLLLFSSRLLNTWIFKFWPDIFSQRVNITKDVVWLAEVICKLTTFLTIKIKHFGKCGDVWDTAEHINIVDMDDIRRFHKNDCNYESITTITIIIKKKFLNKEQKITTVLWYQFTRYLIKGWVHKWPETSQG